LKEASDSAHFISMGRSFQRRGATAEKAQSPYVESLVLTAVRKLHDNDWRDLDGAYEITVQT